MIRRLRNNINQSYKILSVGENPISIDTLKSHAYISDASEDDLLSIYLAAATENFTLSSGFVIPKTQFLLKTDNFHKIRLFRAPVISIDEITYTDPDGEKQTISVDTVHFSDESPTRLICEDYWPATYNLPDSVQIKFTAGHDGEEGSTIPSIVKWAILVMASTAYENREDVVTGISVSSIPNSAQSVIQRYSIVDV